MVDQPRIKSYKKRVMFMFWMIITTIIAAGMATIMIVIRAKNAEQPASMKSILLPPLLMSTGSLMFVFPIFRIDLQQVFEAIGIGMLCSILLIWTTTFEVRGKNIYIKPSKAFIVIISGLLAVRVVYKLIVGQTIAFGELSGAFYLLALGMIVSWRIAMAIKYQKMKQSIQ